MGMSVIELRLEAVERYHQAVRQAELQEYWARLSGKNDSLLKFEEVANRLHIRQQIPLGYRMVQLKEIVGSVGRYREFTKGFLPRGQVLQDRWVAVDVTMNSLQGLPPVELYKIGDGYFVIDGNHRISVSRANGNKDIEAMVIECQTAIPFTVKDFEEDGWLLKIAYREFLAQTQLDQFRPEHRLEVTDAGHYQTLLHHIAVHRYLTNQPRRNHWETRSLSWTDAVLSWYDTIYTPVVETIRRYKLPARFPQRTEADLYIWITQYREEVAETYGLAPLGPEQAVAAFAAIHSERTLHRFILGLQQSVQRSLRRLLRGIEMPPGLREEEFRLLRLRHDAGELSLQEAGRRQIHQIGFAESLCEGEFGMQFSA